MSWGTESDYQSHLTLGDENKWKIGMVKANNCLKNIKMEYDDLNARFDYIKQSHFDMKEIEIKRQNINPMISEMTDYIAQLDQSVPVSQNTATIAMKNQVKELRRKAADLTIMVQKLCADINSELHKRQLARKKEQSIISNELGYENDKRNQDPQMQMTAMESNELRIAQEEEKQSEKIARDMITLESIFVRLSAMVHEQGEVVNRIEANVEDAYVNTAAGEKQLVQAVKHKRSAMKKKICLLGIVLVALAIIALIIGLSVGLNK